MRAYSDLSRDAAIASFAAWDQGKFWEMHDLLFEHAPDLDRDVVDGLAQKLGLDMGLFEKSLDSSGHLQDLKGNLDRIHELDIWSTPTVIINGSVVKGAQPYEKYRDMIEQALGGSSLGGSVRPLVASFLGWLGPARAYADEGTFGMGQVPRWVKAPVLKPTNQLHVGDRAPFPALWTGMCPLKITGERMFF